MKRIVKDVFRLLWKATGPARRPVARRVNGYLRGVVAEALAEQVPPLSRALRDDLLEGEMHCLLDGVIRELVRLQLHLEAIEAHVERGAEGPTAVALSVSAKAGSEAA